MANIASFVAPGRPLRRFRVSLPGGGSERLCDVEDRKPFSKKLLRHVEKVRDLADGRKRIEMVPEQIVHEYDVHSEMVADAVRSYNDADPTQPTKALKQLEVEDLGPVKGQSEPDQVIGHGAGINRPPTKPFVAKESTTPSKG